MKKEKQVKVKIEFPEGGKLEGEMSTERAKKVLKLLSPSLIK